MKFEPGDRFFIASIRGVHFTVINVKSEGAEIELVDQNRRAWDVEVGPDDMVIYGHGVPGPTKKVELHEVHFHG